MHILDFTRKGLLGRPRTEPLTLSEPTPEKQGCDLTVLDQLRAHHRCDRQFKTKKKYVSPVTITTTTGRSESKRVCYSATSRHETRSIRARRKSLSISPRH